MVTDVQFETMGVAVGQVATVRAKLSEESTNLDSKVKREERIKETVGQIRRNESKGKKSNPTK
ncbi:hypothetical protein P5673_005005 [Acropora cervicornis]|uniref:Uncharacterized protein n=1 Tax=Acropora cervicornis TaxID=6130 RepID=A0AAD9VD94_ACRCE|nr:hypothetical protein P5673_005005 [Acropora cervicornis]